MKPIPIPLKKETTSKPCSFLKQSDKSKMAVDSDQSQVLRRQVTPTINHAHQPAFHKQWHLQLTNLSLYPIRINQWKNTQGIAIQIATHFIVV